MSRIKPRYCAECGNKRLYRTEIQARDGLGRIIRERELTKSDVVFGVYECEFHPGWFHCGHNSKALRRLQMMLKTKGVTDSI